MPEKVLRSPDLGFLEKRGDPESLDKLARSSRAPCKNRLIFGRLKYIYKNNLFTFHGCDGLKCQGKKY